MRIAPTGIPPQGRIVRAVLSTEFKDLIGETNPLPITVGSFEVASAVDPGTNTPGDGADEILEEFTVGGAAANKGDRDPQGRGQPNRDHPRYRAPDRGRGRRRPGRRP